MSKTTRIRHLDHGAWLTLSHTPARPRQRLLLSQPEEMMPASWAVAFFAQSGAGGTVREFTSEADAVEYMDSVDAARPTF